MKELNIDSNMPTPQYDVKTEENQSIENVLPPELLDHCLSFLDEKDFQTTAVLNKKWKDLTINKARILENSAVKEFLNYLSNSIDRTRYPNVIIKLSNLNNNNIILNAHNLIEIKYSIVLIKERVIEILEELEKTDLDKFEKSIQDKPQIWLDILTDTKIKKINSLEERQRENAYINIVNQLWMDNNIEKLLVLLEMLSTIKFEVYDVKYIYTDLCSRLLEENNIEDAMKFAISGYRIYKDNNLFKTLAEKLLINNNLNRILEISKTIPESKGGIAIALVRANRLEESMDISSKIEDQNQADEVNIYIATALAKGNQRGRAIEIIEKIKDSNQKKIAYIEISSIFAEHSLKNLN